MPAKDKTAMMKLIPLNAFEKLNYLNYIKIDRNTSQIVTVNRRTIIVNLF